MNKDYQVMNIKQLNIELNTLKKDIKRQEERLHSTDRFERESAKRRLSRLYAQGQLAYDELQKKLRKKERHYKLDQRVKSLTGYTRQEIKDNAVDYYGTTSKQTTKNIVKHIAVIGGVSVVLYGTMWGLYQLHLNGIDNGQDLMKKITATEQQDKGLDLSFAENDDSKLEKFFNTKEGKMIEKYSLIYGVDKSLAASTYINGNGVKIGTYISTYNLQNHKYEDIIVSRDDVEVQTKAVCAELAQYAELCNGNPVMMVAMYEQGYDKALEFINQGVIITDYHSTINNEKINTELVKKILSDCPSVLSNSWYEEGHMYSKIINTSTAIEQTTDEIIDDLAIHNHK